MLDPIPSDLLRFIEGNIESVEQLEILRVLSENAGTPLPASELAKMCQIQPAAIGAQLAALEQRGLLKTQSSDGQTLCQPGASSPEREDLLHRLLQTYRERPVTLIRLIYARANERLKAFADAFRLRKDT